MSSSRPLIDLVRNFRSAGAELDERIDTLVLKGRFPDADSQGAWVALTHAPPMPMIAVQVYDPEIGGDVGPGDAFDPDRRINLTIVKPMVERTGIFFFEEALDQYLSGPIDVVALGVADLSEQTAFRARGLEIGPWIGDEIHVGLPATSIEINPSKLVADHVPNREVPRDLSPWILLTPPAKSSITFEVWRAVGARRLLSGLVSSASLEADTVWLQVAGPPIYRVAATDPELVAAWEVLTEIALWVFLSGSDIEARHRLFCGELGRAARPGQDLGTTLARAFEAAKVAYDAHVQSASRETLKALADLRKTVIEETQKVAQRAQDMAAGLGRDLAVSAAPFVIKLLADAGKVATPWVAAGFYFAAATFVGVSFYLQWQINDAYLKSQEQSRRSWMQTLYTYISAKEREEIADLPIQQAIQNYRDTREVLFVIYLILVAALITAGAVTLI
ncbi:MAG: hypothetical protein ACR65U_08565 [Methylocystis sp.]